MDGLLKVSVDVDLLAQLHKDTGHARVLTDRQIPLPGVQLILLEQLQGLLGQGPGLPKAGQLHGVGYVLGQDGVGPDAQPGHGGGDFSGGYGPHGGKLPSITISPSFYHSEAPLSIIKTIEKRRNITVPPIPSRGGRCRYRSCCTG